MAVAPVQPRHLAQNLLGKPAVEAAGYALSFGYHLRVVEDNGNKIQLPLGEDYDPRRWDIEVTNGIISGIRIPNPPSVAGKKA